ncbi:spore coat protein sp96 [Anaeramoeba flamelloides]|uniref:Spore coat protein sp96 n=1 Tax=Anaeramoeba flamelloides TaxID=1746091 RepID=A0AAV7Y7A3_9EUKA|nr:spore coat protein sp96 [Anaeramoeba flamelloides]
MTTSTERGIQIKREIEEERKEYENERETFIEQLLQVLKSKDQEIGDMVRILEKLTNHHNKVLEAIGKLERQNQMGEKYNVQLNQLNLQQQTLRKQINSKLPQELKIHKEKLDRLVVRKGELQKEVSKIQKLIDEEGGAFHEMSKTVEELTNQIKQADQERQDILSLAKKRRQELIERHSHLNNLLEEKKNNPNFNLNTNTNTNTSTSMNTNNNNSSNNDNNDNSNNENSSNSQESPKIISRKNTQLSSSINLKRETSQLSEKKVFPTRSGKVDFRSEKKRMGRYKWSHNFINLENGSLQIFDKENGNLKKTLDISGDSRTFKKVSVQKRKHCLEIKMMDNSIHIFSVDRLDDLLVWYRDLRECRNSKL